MADDLGREPIPDVAGASGCPHPTRLLTPICSCKRGKARQVDGAGLRAQRRITFKIGGQVTVGWEPAPSLRREVSGAGIVLSCDHAGGRLMTLELEARRR